MPGEPLQSARAHERAKYEHLFENRIDYGTENHGKDALPFIREVRPHTLLDVGCGKNILVRQLRNEGVEAVGVDFACGWADVVAPAHDLPFPERSFDMLTAFDVLEHLLPEEVDEVLREFRRLSNQWLFSICYRDSHNRVHGETLHPTVRSKEWWEEKLSQYGRVRYWRNQYTIIYCGSNDESVSA